MRKSRKSKRQELDAGTPAVRFMYSEAVVKVLRQYGSCVNMVRNRYPSPYLYRDNTNLSLQNLPKLSDSYPDIPDPEVQTAREVSSQVHIPRSQRLPNTELHRSTTYFLPRISDAKREPIKEPSTLPKVGPDHLRRNYHRKYHVRFAMDSPCTFITERRSAYNPHRLPTALGPPPPCTYNNRAILEKMWKEKIPLCRK